MKSQILKILQMQEQGKLTQDQAAELLAVLADQAREKGVPLEGGGVAGGGEEERPRRERGRGTSVAGRSAGPAGPPPPRPTSPSTGNCAGGFGSTAAAAIHELVDTAIGVGTTVGRAASMWGGEFLNMVHRDEGGNSVTLSKVDGPQGEAYSFRGNTVNVSKIVHLHLQQAEFSGNCLNASKVAHVEITPAFFAVQCERQCAHARDHRRKWRRIPGGTPEAGEAGTVQVAGIRNVTFNATKFTRVTLGGNSSFENSASRRRPSDVELIPPGSVLKDMRRVNDSTLAALRMDKASVAPAGGDSHVQWADRMARQS